MIFVKVFKRIIQGIGFFLLAVVLFYFVAKITGFVKLKEFYANSTKEFTIPGLFENFIPQGLEYDEAKESFLVSGYTKNNEKSPLYIVNNDKSVKKIYLKNSLGEECLDHFGGVTIYKNYLIAAGGNGASTGRQFVYIFNLEDIYAAEENAFVSSLNEIDVYVGTAFVNVIGDYLYVGEYNHDGSPLYDIAKTVERDWMPEDAKAIMLKYALKEDATFDKAPVACYEIQDEIQGMLVTKEGEMAFSHSYGINPAHMSFHQDPKTLGDITIDGATIPLYSYNKETETRRVSVSPMIEAIVYANDRIYTLNESASSKYLYGLAFRGKSVYAFDYNHQ